MEWSRATWMKCAIKNGCDYKKKWERVKAIGIELCGENTLLFQFFIVIYFIRQLADFAMNVYN